MYLSLEVQVWGVQGGGVDRCGHGVGIRVDVGSPQGAAGGP